MPKGDVLGALACPCCGQAWKATESKTQGVSLVCPKGFQGLAKNPASTTGILAALGRGKPASGSSSASSSPAKPAKGDDFASFVGG